MRGTPYRPLHATDVTSWDLTTDVAVVGFGAAGACAALEAAHAGAEVALFESGAGSGGASALSGGEIYLGGTEVQRNAGFEDTTEALRSYLTMVGGDDPDLEKCEVYANESPDHFTWLKEQGVPYKGTFLPGKIIEPETDDTLIWSGSEQAWPFAEAATPAPRGHTIQYVGVGGGRALMDILEARVREAGVDVRLNARAQCLVLDDDERVIGIVVRIDNRPVHVRTRRGVVLATGGFGMNRDMLAQHAPKTLRLSTPIGENDNGSGIQMGVGAGGNAVHMDEFFTTCPWIVPPDLVKGIFVNEAGQRFVNEDCYHGRVSRAMLDQPGSKVWLLVDDAIFGRPLDAARISVAAVGETWEEVERELGLPEESLARTVHTFNRYAAEGRDPLHHKAPAWLKVLDDGPFAALELNFTKSTFTYFTLGGLATNVSGEVLGRDGAPVPGLFAAGRVTSGLPRTGHTYSSGLSLADCTFFGRKAGRAAAAGPPR
ncbi:FAD-dependent oxidoreductase [Pseudonocardia xishanensis]|uniref:FAD-binding protein n=1 Tax=Pseudonocardia xishanensis TaxID=630995 RepID=A0ABP8RRS3_9PSEU